MQEIMNRLEFKSHNHKIFSSFIYTWKFIESSDELSAANEPMLDSISLHSMFPVSESTLGGDTEASIIRSRGPIILHSLATLAAVIKLSPVKKTNFNRQKETEYTQ